MSVDETPLQKAIVGLLYNDLSDMELRKAILNVCWQSAYYYDKSPMLTGTTLVEALDELEAQLYAH